MSGHVILCHQLCPGTQTCLPGLLMRVLHEAEDRYNLVTIGLVIKAYSDGC